MKSIFILFTTAIMLCGCGVYTSTTYVTASLDWCKDNGDTLRHWDNIILQKVMTNTNDNGYGYGASGINTTLVRSGGVIDFMTAEGRQEIIGGGLVRIYNIRETTTKECNSGIKERTATNLGTEYNVTN